MVEGRTYRYNNKTGVWKNFAVYGNDDGVFVSVMEGGKGDRKQITLRLTPAEVAYFAMVFKVLARREIEAGKDTAGKKRDNDDF